MSFEPTPVHKEDRLSIRATPLEKSMLAKAAQARHMNVSQFVLTASLREAQQVIQEESRLLISEEDYVWLCEILDSGGIAPRLLEALSKPPVWDEKS